MKISWDEQMYLVIAASIISRAETMLMIRTLELGEYKAQRLSEQERRKMYTEVTDEAFEYYMFLVTGDGKDIPVDVKGEFVKKLSETMKRVNAINGRLHGERLSQLIQGKDIH